MKYSAVALAAFLAVASAQADITIIPECARGCIEEATTKASDCEVDDYKCICLNAEDAIVPAATGCVLAECGNAVALNEVLPATVKFCEAVLAGGDDEEPTEPEPSTTAAPEPSSTAAPEPSSAPAETSSEPVETSSAVISDYPTVTISTSVTAAPTAEPSGAEPSSTAPVTAGAAGIAGSFGLLLLGAVAAL